MTERDRKPARFSTPIAASALAVALGTGVSAQDALRTSWGDPDLQGIWVGSTLTPLERPSEYEGRAFLTRDEVTAIETEARAHGERLLKRPAERAPAGGDVNYRADGSLGYDHFWIDEGAVWEPSGRTSLIVDPPSGRIPYTPTALDHARPYGAGPWDSHLDLDTGERCFGDGLPQIWFGDNPNHQIFQTPTDVVILHEMYHQRQIIPIDGRPQTGITQWNGGTLTGITLPRPRRAKQRKKGCAFVKLANLYRSLSQGCGALFNSWQIARLSGRVDGLESTMQTEIRTQLKMLAAEPQTMVHRLVCAGLNAVFAEHHKPDIAR